MITPRIADCANIVKIHSQKPWPIINYWCGNRFWLHSFLFLLPEIGRWDRCDCWLLRVNSVHVSGPGKCWRTLFLSSFWEHIDNSWSLIIFHHPTDTLNILKHAIIIVQTYCKYSNNLYFHPRRPLQEIHPPSRPGGMGALAIAKVSRPKDTLCPWERCREARLNGLVATNGMVYWLTIHNMDKYG